MNPRDVIKRSVAVCAFSPGGRVFGGGGQNTLENADSSARRAHVFVFKYPGELRRKIRTLLRDNATAPTENHPLGNIFS